MSRGGSLVWFRHDLRLSDNPALDAALRSTGPITPVFIHSPDEEGRWRPGAASDWWLHHSLRALAQRLERQGLPLIVRRGPALEVLVALIEETGATAVHWNRRYEPAVVNRDRGVKRHLRESGIEAHSHNAALLFEPWQIQTRSGTAYRAFTPFWRACRQYLPPPSPLAEPVPTGRQGPVTGSLTVDALGLLPDVRWDTGLEAAWEPGEAGAHRALERFLDATLSGYGDARERPAVNGTSRLSPHLHFGEIGPRQVWHAVSQHTAPVGAAERDADRYLAEIGWREFAHHVLFHHPDFPEKPLNPSFARLPWRNESAELLRAWQRGRTGFPIVDAGMRELWETGWMHNRVRMIAGSLLVKNLRVPWQQGEAWFWDTLVDADLASNSLGWQWVAGSGADAAPFFRIFNPVRQSERFDPDAEYISRWVPEITRLPVRHRHAPWEAPGEALDAAALRLGSDYPYPIVDLKRSRREALEAFEAIKSNADPTG